MQTRKEMKRSARQTVRKHYAILLAVCFVAILLGAEYKGSLGFLEFPSIFNGSDSTDSGVKDAGAAGLNGGGIWNVVDEVLNGALDQGAEDAGQLEQQEQQQGTAILGRSRGVLAGLVNGVSSGMFLVKIVRMLYGFGLSEGAARAIFALVIALVALAFWFFFKNMYGAISRRLFLESRIYEKVTPQRIMFFIRAKKWCNVSLNMFMVFLFQTLWSLTIVGGWIKHYSYYLVPYIVAENPEISWRDSIALSKRMMKGHKWECFVFELSFLGWYLLGLLTLGLVDFFYTNSYKTAAMAEYYAGLRSLSKERQVPGSELLCDRYLFEKADEALLQERYADIIATEKALPPAPEYHGVRGWIEKNFGIVMYPRSTEEKLQLWGEKRLLISVAQDAVAAVSYPDRLSPNPIHQKNNRVLKMHYLRHYSITSLILLFFSFSFVGWLWEVSLHLVNDGKFVNRGTMHGPWLPIYGFGGVFILVLLYRLRKSPMLEFGAAIVLCGMAEYWTSYFLEVTHNGMRWWDYSGYFLNLNGRICAEGLFVFGVGGMAIVYFLAPAIDNKLRKIRPSVTIPLCAVLLAAFIGDQIYSHKHPNSGKGITDYDRTGASVTVPAELPCNAHDHIL